MNRIVGKRGLRPISPDARAPLFSSFFDASKLPVPPSKFGWWDAVPANAWGMLGNDRYSCCVEAGYAHHVMYWASVGAGARPPLTLDQVLAAYSGITNFSRWNPLSDQGTDMDAAAEYWRTTGMADAAGGRHRVQMYARLDPGDWDQLRLGMWLGSGAGLGLYLPPDAESAFSAGHPWTETAGRPGDGHYVAGLGVNSRGLAVVVTWGALQALTQQWYERYCAAAYVYLSQEALTAKGLTREGFDAEALVGYLRRIA